MLAPCTVTDLDPVPARLPLRVMLIDPRSDDNASLTLPWHRMASTGAASSSTLLDVDQALRRGSALPLLPPSSTMTSLPSPSPAPTLQRLQPDDLALLQWAWLYRRFDIFNVLLLETSTRSQARLASPFASPFASRISHALDLDLLHLH
jgi:hypothetical protein